MTRPLIFAAAACLAISGITSAQTKKHPTPVGDQYLSTLGAKMKFESLNKLSGSANAAVKANQAQASIVSVPNWSASFTTAGVTYPYTMVGARPQLGGTTNIATSLIPISLFFDEFVDNAGNNITVDVTPLINKTLHSPNFDSTVYDDGAGQFGDAVQRAEFFNVMGADWHTKLASPRMLTPVTVEIPPGAALLFQTSKGTLITLLEVNFFVSQLNTIVQLEGLKETELPIILTPDVFLFDNFDPNQCCILGFHTAFETKVVEKAHFVQTFAWASWIDPLIFRDPSVADVLALSHEISEWMNDPFVNNVTPPWQFPDGSGACQGDLETGDPVEVLGNSGFGVLLNGFLYHPQNEALLQWFSREIPSSAFKGAYSFPDRGILPKPSLACAQGGLGTK